MRKIFVVLSVLFLSFNLYPQQITIKLNEGFESQIFPPTGWRRINVAGANQWQRLTNPYPSIIMQPPVNGIAVARINYEYFAGEDWLITKKVNSITAGDSLFFYLIKQSDQGPFPPDSMLIRISTTDSLQNSFTNILININIAALPTGNQVWHRYSFPLDQFAGQNIFIAFQHKDVNGHGCAIDSVVVFNPGSIGITKTGSKIPDSNKLYQNYPNPFNPNTTIKLQIKKDGFTVLKVFDILGREAATLVSEYLSAGTYQLQFPPPNYSSGSLQSGIYFYKLLITNLESQISDFSEVKAMILIK
jgi:hypothetical protein